jgi:hypothetical protein
MLQDEVVVTNLALKMILKSFQEAVSSIAPNSDMQLSFLMCDVSP